MRRAAEFSTLQLKHSGPVRCMTLSADGRWVISGSDDKQIKIWDLSTGALLHALSGHTASVRCLAASQDGQHLVSGAYDSTIGLWHLPTATLRNTLAGHTAHVWTVQVSPASQIIASGSDDNTVRLWDLHTGTLLKALVGHQDYVRAISFSPTGEQLVSASFDGTIKQWDVATGELLKTLEGHNSAVWSIAVSPCGKYVASGSFDATINIWESATGKLLYTLQGHSASVRLVAFTSDSTYLLSGSDDNTIRVWNTNRWDTLAKLSFKSSVVSVASTQALIAACDTSGELKYNKIVSLSHFDAADTYEQYLNAKVILVGDTGVGKTGLGIRLAENRWQVTESTHGMSFWRLPVPAGADSDRIRKEVILWDFAGQEDFLLIHQLFLDHTCLVLLLFDPGAPHTFERVEYWINSVGNHLGRDVPKLLVAARSDRATAKVSSEWIAVFCARHSIAKYLTVSAKTGDGIEELRSAIIGYVPWSALEVTSSPKLFRLIQNTLQRLVIADRILITYDELAELLTQDTSGSQPDPGAVASAMAALANMGLIMTVAPTTKARYALLRPDIVDQYAASILRHVATAPHGIGAITDREIVEADFDLSDIARLRPAEEQVVLQSTVELFLSRMLCFRHFGRLIFPSKMRFDPPPEAQGLTPDVIFDFAGPLDNIYASLIVELIYTDNFQLVNLWRNCAEFRAEQGGQCAIQFTSRNNTKGHLSVSFATDGDTLTRIRFSQIVRTILRREALDLEETISVRCQCGYTFDDDVVGHRKSEGKVFATCPRCDRPVSLSRSLADTYNPELNFHLADVEARVLQNRNEAIRDAQGAVTIHIAAAEDGRPEVLRILHLSDIHFAADTRSADHLQPLQKDLTGLGVKRLDALVVSGDLVQTAAAEEYRVASAFLQELMQSFGLSADRLALVPGNHDVSWPISEQEGYRRLLGVRQAAPFPPGFTLLQGKILYVRDPDGYEQRFRTFSEHLYKHIFNVSYPTSTDRQATVTKISVRGTPRLIFLNLNSCFEIDFFFPDRSGISPSALTFGLEQGDAIDSSDALKIAVFHHPLNGEDALSHDFMERLTAHNFGLCLHGHVHRPISEHYRWYRDSGIPVVGAGTFGAHAPHRPESMPYQYNYIEVDTRTRVISVNTRKKETATGMWTADARWGDKSRAPAAWYKLRY